MKMIKIILGKGNFKVPISISQKINPLVAVLISLKLSDGFLGSSSNLRKEKKREREISFTS